MSGGKGRGEGVPDGWQQMRLGDVITIASGQVSPLEEPYASQLHLGPENIESGTGKIEESNVAKDLGLISGKYSFDEHAIVYSKIRPELNKVCSPDFRGICSADMYPIWPDTQYIEKNYLLQYMLSPQFVTPMVLASSRTGMPKVNRKDFNCHNVALPPLPEQRKIAAILGTWDDGLATLAALIAAKREQKRGLAQLLLTGERRLAGFAGEWKQSTLGDHLQQLNERNKTAGIELVLSVTNHSGFVLPEEQFSKRVASKDISNYRVVRRGDFAYNPSRINVGSLARLTEFEEAVVSPLYVVFRPKAEVDGIFLLNWLESDATKARIENSTQGSVRDSVNYSTLADFPFKLPPLPEQRAIAGVLSTLDAEITALEGLRAGVQEQKRGLMDELLTGRTRVKV